MKPTYPAARLLGHIRFTPLKPLKKKGLKYIFFNQCTDWMTNHIQYLLLFFKRGLAWKKGLDYSRFGQFVQTGNRQPISKI